MEHLREQQLLKEKLSHIEENPKYQKLIAEKKSFIVKGVIFFVIYYFLLPISVGFFPEIMKKQVIGSINLAYLFALSQFFMAWILAYLYVQKANKVFDPLAEEIIKEVKGGA